MKVPVVRVVLAGPLKRRDREIERSGTANRIDVFDSPYPRSPWRIGSERDQFLAHQERALGSAAPEQKFGRKLTYGVNILVRERGNKSLVELPAELGIKVCNQILGKIVKHELAVAPELPASILIRENPQHIRAQRGLLDIFEAPFSGVILVLAAFLEHDRVVRNTENAFRAMPPVPMTHHDLHRLRRGQQPAVAKNQESANLGFTSKCHFHTS